MKRFACFAIAAVLLAAPSSAEWTMGAEVNFDTRLLDANQYGQHVVPIGSFNATHFSQYGYIWGTVQPWNAYGGFFGAQWDGPVDVYKLTLDQLNDPARLRPDKVYIYTSADPKVAPYVVHLDPARGVQEVNFVTLFGGPIRAENSYLLVAVQEMYAKDTMYDNSNANDINFGLNFYRFDAKAVGKADTNLNRDAVKVEFVGALWNYPGRTNDNRIATYGNDTLTFWTRDPSGNIENKLIVTYDGPKTIGSIGLAMVGDAGAGDRDCPKWVYLIPDGDLDRMQKVLLDEGMMAYGRYVLPDGPMVNVTELTLLMPAGDDLSAWIVRTDRNYGITEFQAFAVPEPATMALLALGGLALLRRRK